MMIGTFASSSEEATIAPYEKKTGGPLEVASGALMMIPVIGKRSPWRWTAAVVGGALVYRGVTQRRPHASRQGASSGTSTVERFTEAITIGRSAQELYPPTPERIATYCLPSGPRYVTGCPGTAMPEMGVTDEDARRIARFLEANR